MKKLIYSLLFLSLLTIFVNYAKATSVHEILNAIEWVESRKDTSAYNASEQANGCLQIRPIMLADYVRITGDHSIKHSDLISTGTSDIYTARKLSYKVAEAVLEHYMRHIERKGYEVYVKHLVFIWNGGGSAWKRVEYPRGDNKQNNLERYWDKVQLELTR
jgi:aromatic ring hydroxylase